MPAYSTKFLSKKEVAEKTMAFFFEKPKKFKFTAGQSLGLYLLKSKYKDEKGLLRWFSIASSPNEKELVIATRMRDSAFKKTLKEMPINEKVKIEGPYGNLILPKDAKKPVVFIAGGIGITPFRSMIKFAADKKMSHKITLFFSNRRPEDAPFLEELKELERQNKNFKLVATMTDMKNSSMPWDGPEGYIDQKMIKSNLRNWKNAAYYIAGPPGFVQSMADMLSKMKIKPDQVKTENFSGY